MEQQIRLADHVQNKLRNHQRTPSDECNLSYYSAGNDSVFLSPSPEKDFLRRSATFTTYQILPECEPSSTDRRCNQCLRRAHLLYHEHQRCLTLDKTNQNLTEQLRLAIALNHRYEEENSKVQSRHQMSFNQLEEKGNIPVDHLARLRRELQIYNQTIARRDQKEMDYFSRPNRTNVK